MVNDLDLVEELQARSDLSARDAIAIVRVLRRAIDDARDEQPSVLQLRERLARAEAGVAALKAEVATIKGQAPALRSLGPGQERPTLNAH